MEDRYEKVLVLGGGRGEDGGGASQREKGEEVLVARMMFRMILDCLHRVTQQMTKWLADGGNSSGSKEYGPYNGMTDCGTAKLTKSQISGVARGSFTS